MPATSRVYTLRHAAKLWGETEDTVSDAAISMFFEDGAIQIMTTISERRIGPRRPSSLMKVSRTSDTSSTKPGFMVHSIICANAKGAHRMHRFRHRLRRPRTAARLFRRMTNC